VPCQGTSLPFLHTHPCFHLLILLEGCDERCPRARFPWVPMRPGAALRALTYPIDPTEPSIRPHALPALCLHRCCHCCLVLPLTMLLLAWRKSNSTQVKLNAALTLLYPPPLPLCSYISHFRSIHRGAYFAELRTTTVSLGLATKSIVLELLGLYGTHNC